MTAVPACSRWRQPSATRWPEWLARAPALVAEELQVLRDPLAAWLSPGPNAAPEAVAAALARAFLPPVAAEEPPDWLRPDQRLAFGRTLAAVRRFGGALLADGVGTGKTYVALAVASVLAPDQPVYAIVPASLRGQWLGAAKRTRLEVVVHSHEALSRGRVPGGEPGAAIVDESHRFREHSTIRYRTLRRWCVGKRGVLLSATPAVNRLEDVAHQLLLFVRDDALAWRGAPTLLAGRFAELVVTGADRSGVLPRRQERSVRVAEASDGDAAMLRRGIEALVLSEDAGIASLLRITLLVALASSPAAAAESLARYRALLLHARDALAAGQRVTRHRIRHLVGSALEQLVLWPMVAEPRIPPDLALEDLGPAAALERSARALAAGTDPKLEVLRGLITDRKPTLVFSTFAATVRHIRAGLGTRGVAWCTGNASGLDRMPAPREVVLDWFRRPSPPHPVVLAATDVAAEGLDLPLVERVVHYDLPWTAVRVEQRTGRAIRLTSTARAIEVIRLLPGTELEARIRKEAVLDAKHGLPATLGLGQEASAPWKLRARIAEAWRGCPAMEGSAQVRGNAAAVVAGFRLVGLDGAVRDVVKAWTGNGWTDDLETVARLLAAGRGERSVTGPSAASVKASLRHLSPLVRETLRTLYGATAVGIRPTATQRRMLRRLRRLAARASRSRDVNRLTWLERGIGFVRRGHTAGEDALLEEWLHLTDQELMARLGGLSAVAREGVLRVELFGLLVVESAQPGR